MVTWIKRSSINFVGEFQWDRHFLPLDSKIQGNSLRILAYYLGFWIIYWKCLMAKHLLFDFIIGKSINQYAHNWGDGLQYIISSFPWCLFCMASILILANFNQWLKDSLHTKTHTHKYHRSQLIPIRGTRAINPCAEKTIRNEHFLVHSQHHGMLWDENECQTHLVKNDWRCFAQQTHMKNEINGKMMK